MSIFKKWFIENPSKVLGVEVEKENWRKKGETIFVVEGELSNLENIDVPDSFMPKKGIGVKGIKSKSISSEQQDKNLQKAHDVVEQKKLKKKSTKAVKRKKKKDFSKMRFIPAATEVELQTFENSIKELNEGLDEGYLKSWVFYKKTQNHPLHSSYDAYFDNSEEYLTNALEKGFICYDPEEGYLPSVLYYSGNIYSRLSRMNRDTSGKITNEQKRKQIQKLKSILPAPLKIRESEEKRLNINYQGLFCKQVEITMYGETISLHEAFWEFVKGLTANDFKYQNQGNGSKMYLVMKNRIQFGVVHYAWKNWTEKEKQQYRQKSTQELHHQMYRFLTEIIDVRDLTAIEKRWNVEHNGYVEPNYDFIPVGFEHNTMFKDAPLEVRKAQREGVSFMDISGNGIIAYDVGVGKTMTSILAVGNALANGQCKRPIIVVPNPTYYKWLAEIRGVYDADGNVISEGILPQYKINNFYNLGKDVLEDIWNPETGLNEPISDYSITLMTYQGLEKLGLSPELGEAFKSEVAGIITQKAERTDKQKTADENETIKMLSRSKKGQLIWLDQANWDYMVIDEAHNMNKIFRRVENNDDKEKNILYSFKQQGALPARAIKAFALSRYIQKNNSGRNVCLLTATPFNNSPLEVFSVLALADLDRLKRLGLGSLRTFFDEYIFTTYERVVKAGNKIETQQVIKGWNNKVSLQNVMFSIMNYKSGEDIDELQRPDKHIFPKISEEKDGVFRTLPPEEQRKTYLMPSESQAHNFKEIDAWYKMAKNSEELKQGADLVVLGRGKSNTFSPHSYYITKNFSSVDYSQSERDALAKEYVQSLDPIDIIEESPKLKYTVECIKSIIQHHKSTKTEIGGVIIYSNTGKALFPKIKEYLEQEVGYNPEGYKPAKKWYSEVEIISGDTNSTDKENIKKGFNSGEIKVVIGSSTIREGIDLQKKTTTIFNLYNEWNPTSYKQLEGRAWRQGNQYANVRIVTPLLIDSSDAMVWQKMEEKTGRINDIFDRKDKTNILDVQTEDREAIKWSIMQDTEAIAREMIQEEVNDKEQEIAKAEATLSDIEKLGVTKQEKIDAYTAIYNKVKMFKHFDPSPEPKSTVLDIFDRLSAAKNEIHAKTMNPYTKKSDFMEHFKTSRSDLKEYQRLNNNYERGYNFVVSNFGEDMVDNLPTVVEMLNGRITELKEVDLAKLKSESYVMERKAKIDAERKKVKAGALSFDETVKIFTSTNYLMDELAKKPKTDKENFEEAIELSYKMLTIATGELKAQYQEAIELLEKMYSNMK